VTTIALPSFIRVTEAARQLGWPLRRVREASDEGLLPRRVRPFGRIDYFVVDELRAALAKLPTVTVARDRLVVVRAREMADRAQARRGRRGRRRRAHGSTGSSA